MNSKLIINTTSIGLNNETSPLKSNFMSKDAFVFDIIYKPVYTDLLNEAKDAGSNIIFGYEMLIHQAAKSFEIWTGIQCTNKCNEKSTYLEFLVNRHKLKKLTSTSTVFGVISIINAIATGKDYTLGISLKVKAKITLEPGFSGISKNFANDKLINKIIKSIIPNKILNNNFVHSI